MFKLLIILKDNKTRILTLILIVVKAKKIERAWYSKKKRQLVNIYESIKRDRQSYRLIIYFESDNKDYVITLQVI